MPVAQLPTPNRARRSRGPSEEQRRLHREIITKLYLTNTLKQIMDIMLSQHQFHATKWGFAKNLRPELALILARVQAQRKLRGEASHFYMLSRHFTLERLKRYVRDNPKAMASLQWYLAQDQHIEDYIESILPAGIFVMNPSLPFNAQIDSLEELLHSLQSYVSTIEERKVCLNHHTNYSIVGSPQVGKFADIQPWWLDPRGLRTVAYLIIQAEFDNLRYYVFQDDYALISSTLIKYAIIACWDKPEVAVTTAVAWLKHACDLSAIIKGQDHLLSIVLGKILEWANGDMTSGSASLQRLHKAEMEFIAEVRGKPYEIKLGLKILLSKFFKSMEESFEAATGGTEHNLVHLMDSFEDANDAKRAMQQIILLLPTHNSEILARGLLWIEEHHWSEAVSHDILMRSYVAFLNRRWGNLSKFLKGLCQFLEHIWSAWVPSEQCTNQPSDLDSVDFNSRLLDDFGMRAIKVIMRDRVKSTRMP